MDGFSLSSVCTWMQIGNGRSMLGLDNSSSCHNRDIGDLSIVNASDINSLIGLFNDMNVITSNATIGTSIYESLAMSEPTLHYLWEEAE